MNKPWEPLDRETRIRSEYADDKLCEPREGCDSEIDWLETAAELARKEARRVKADKLIEFLRRRENA